MNTGGKKYNNYVMNNNSNAKNTVIYTQHTIKQLYSKCAEDALYYERYVIIKNNIIPQMIELKKRE